MHAQTNTAECASYRYLRCVVNVMLLLSQLSFSFVSMQLAPMDLGCALGAPGDGPGMGFANPGDMDVSTVRLCRALSRTLRWLIE